MTRDLEVTLREALATISRLADRREIGAHDLYGLRLDRLKDISDAALSAASGEASGDCPVCGRGDEPSCKTVGCPDDRPAPSEAPNVERHLSSIGEAAPLLDALSATYARSDKCKLLASALDSARADGIAAEKKRCADIAEWFEDHEDDSAVARCAGLIAEIISREAKP